MKYFVKLAGKAFGPLEEEKIVEMYHNGRLKDPVEISRDKKVWDSIDIILPSTDPPPDLSPIKPLFDDIDLIPDEGLVTQKNVDPNGSVWFYSADGAKGYGPVTKSDLETMLQCGMLKSNSLVWRQGENSRPISIVPELMDILYNGGASPSPPAGLGGGFNPASSFSTAPKNPTFGNSPFNPFSNQGGMAPFQPGLTGSSAGAGKNMFDLVDDQDFGNDSFGQGSYTPTGKTSRSVYLLLALLLGQFGVHNFYAGRMEVGIVQLFIGLTNLVCLIVIMCISLASEGNGQILFAIPGLIGLGLQIWAIVEICIVTNDGNGKRMY